MAIKIKKKVEVEGQETVVVERPDEVLVATQETFGWLQTHFWNIIGVIATVCIALIVWGAVQKNREKSRVEAARGVFEAVDLSARPAAPGEDEAEEEGTGERVEPYETVQARATAVRDAAGAVATEQGERPSAQAAELLAAASSLALGEAADSIARFGRIGGSDMAGVIAQFGVATAKAESGDLAGARETLHSIASAHESLSRATGLLEAQFVDTWGEPRDALDLYRAWRSAAGDDEAGLDGVDNRIGQLEIALNVEPLPPPDAAAGSGDAAGSGADAVSP